MVSWFNVSTKISMAVIDSLTELYNQPIIWENFWVNCTKVPSFGDDLNTFSTSGAMCRKEVTSVNTTMDVTRVHLVSVLHVHAWHVPVKSKCVRGGKYQDCHKQKEKGLFGVRSPLFGDKGSYLVDYLIFLWGMERAHVTFSCQCWPENACWLHFWGRLTLQLGQGLRPGVVTWPNRHDTLLAL